jgi:hypothetical protein
MVLPAGDTPHPGKMLDMMMLVGFGGQERTEPEYGELLGKAGLRLTRVVPTESLASQENVRPVYQLMVESSALAEGSALPESPSVPWPAKHSTPTSASPLQYAVLGGLTT